MEKQYITKHAANIVFAITGGIRHDNDSLRMDVDCIGNVEISVNDGTKKFVRSAKFSKESFLKLKEFMTEAEEFLRKEKAL